MTTGELEKIVKRRHNNKMEILLIVILLGAIWLGISDRIADKKQKKAWGEQADPLCPECYGEGWVKYHPVGVGCVPVDIPCSCVEDTEDDEWI